MTADAVGEALGPAELHDLVYHFRNFGAEAERVLDQLQALAPDARTLLDVGCGTGQHLATLSAFYDVVGVDPDPAMLAVAGRRLRDVPLHALDMRDFDLGRTFDAITCLGGTVAHAATPVELAAALGRLVAHLAPGGVLLLEPWFGPATYPLGSTQALSGERGPLRVSRMTHHGRRDGQALLDIQYLVGEPEGITHLHERLVLGLFEPAALGDALSAHGLRVTVPPRGAIVAQQP